MALDILEGRPLTPYDRINLRCKFVRVFVELDGTDGNPWPRIDADLARLVRLVAKLTRTCNQVVGIREGKLRLREEVVGSWQVDLMMGV